MSRIDETFKRLKDEGRKAFIPYIMAGDPSLRKTEQTVMLLKQCGADIIELGVPFSDPLADGPVIQRAAERALKKGVTLRDVIRLVTKLRKSTTIPIILMTYYNPVYKYGEARFMRDAARAGVDGLIVPDLPPDEAEDLMGLSYKHGVDLVFLLAPTSTAERVRKVARAARGFIYYVSVTGITGSKLTLGAHTKKMIQSARAHGNKPVALGFGVSTPQEARAAATMADGVIVGSAIVKRINEPDLKRFVTDLRKAIG